MAKTRSLIDLKGIIIDAETVSKPSTKIFREAWEIVGPVIAVNMVEAREIWRDYIRVVRKPKFEVLDVWMMKGLETGSDITGIITEKQELRDAPAYQPIADATTPEELMLAIPPGFSLREIIERGREG